MILIILIITQNQILLLDYLSCMQIILENLLIFLQIFIIAQRIAILIILSILFIFHFQLIILISIIFLFSTKILVLGSIFIALLIQLLIPIISSKLFFLSFLTFLTIFLFICPFFKSLNLN